MLRSPGWSDGHDAQVSAGLDAQASELRGVDAAGAVSADDEIQDPGLPLGGRHDRRVAPSARVLGRRRADRAVHANLGCRPSGRSVPNAVVAALGSHCERSAESKTQNYITTVGHSRSSTELGADLQLHGLAGLADHGLC